MKKPKLKYWILCRYKDRSERDTYTLSDYNPKLGCSNRTQALAYLSHAQEMGGAVFTYRIAARARKPAC